MLQMSRLTSQALGKEIVFAVMFPLTMNYLGVLIAGNLINNCGLFCYAGLTRLSRLFGNVLTYIYSVKS